MVPLFLYVQCIVIQSNFFCNVLVFKALRIVSCRALFSCECIFLTIGLYMYGVPAIHMPSAPHIVAHPTSYAKRIKHIRPTYNRV